MLGGVEGTENVQNHTGNYQDVSRKIAWTLEKFSTSRSKRRRVQELPGRRTREQPPSKQSRMGPQMRLSFSYATMLQDEDVLIDRGFPSFRTQGFT